MITNYLIQYQPKLYSRPIPGQAFTPTRYTILTFKFF